MRDHPEGPDRKFLVPEQVLPAVVIGERLALSIDEMMRTGREDALGSSLHMEDEIQILEPLVPLPFGDREDILDLGRGQGRVKRGHLLALGRERDLRDSRPARPDDTDFQACPDCRHDERSFRRIALHDPPVALSFEGRVVAQDSAFQELPQSRVRG